MRSPCIQGAAASLLARPTAPGLSAPSLVSPRPGICSRQGRYQDCTRFATAAAGEAELAGHRSGLAHALYLEHMMSVYLGQPEDELAFRALAIFEEIGDLVGQGNVLNNLGIGAYYRGRWAESLDHYEASRRARVRSGDVVGAATEENNIAEILSDQGDLEAARPLFESARATWTGGRLSRRCRARHLEPGPPRGEGRQRRPWARACSKRRSTTSARIRSPIFIAETEVRLAECLVLEGQFAEAVARSRDLLAGFRGRPGLEQVELTTLRLLGTASGFAELTDTLSGGPSLWVESLGEAIARAVDLDAPYELALALAARSAIGVRFARAKSPSSGDRGKQT